MQSDAEYRCLLTNRDIDRIEMLIGLLRDATLELFEKRQLLPTKELDTDADYHEMRMHELSAKLCESGSYGPNGRQIF